MGLKISEITLLYFFSALAQSAAAFAALVAVFAVFRLQANAAAIVQKYLEAKHWLKHVAKSSTVDGISDAQVKQVLDAEALLRSEARQLLDKIVKAESVNSTLANTVSGPLKWWACIFLLSLGALPVSKLLTSWRAIAIVAGFVIAAARALQITRRFVQECLRFG